MSGRLGLHGGAEYLAGDEPFLRLLLDAAGPTPGRALRVAVVPAAAANGRPDLAGRTGVEAFRRVAVDRGRELDAAVVPIVDDASAHDPALIERLAAADLIHLPGGDPALVPAILAGTPAWLAIVEAWTRGAALAGSSAGAMGLCEWTWTDSGVRPGLGLVRGLVVVPHFDRLPRERWEQERDAAAAAGAGLLGLDEQTGILSEPAVGDITWRVAGPGAAHWIRPGADEPLVRAGGELIVLQGSAIVAS